MFLKAKDTTKKYNDSGENTQESINTTNPAVVGSFKAEKPNKTAKETKLNMKNAIIFGFILLAVFSAGWFLSLSVNVQEVQVSAVCGDDVVIKYNEVSLLKQQDGSEEYIIDESGLTNLVAEIQKKQGYQGDPTCQMVLLESAIYDKNYEAAKNAYDIVLELHDKQQYADSNLRTGGPLSTYESFVEELSQNNPDVSNQEPEGGA